MKRESIRGDGNQSQAPMTEKFVHSVPEMVLKSMSHRVYNLPSATFLDNMHNMKT